MRKLHEKERGRLVVVTGARQCGKTTLAGMAFSKYPVVDMDSPAERVIYQGMTPAQWIDRFPRAVIDEAQKLPEIFETIKACHDRDPRVRYVLLGSSQILLMARLRETLSGRAALRELYPFSLPEILNRDGDRPPPESRLLSLLRSADPPSDMPALFPPDLSLGDSFARAAREWESLVVWGGMPPVKIESWSDGDRFEWLQDYQATYLQRDLADLARLDRLEPFVRAQKAAALRTSRTVNFSKLARLADVSPPTARQFMRYLEISYQIVMLPGWFRNPAKRLVKQPRLHFVDPGIRRAILNRRGPPDGAEFESAIVAEAFKQCRTARLPVEFFHLRTADGREIDLLLEREDGFFAFECKQSRRVGPVDSRHFRGLGDFLDKPLLLGAIVSEDPECAEIAGLDRRVWKVPAAALLSGSNRR